MKDPQMNKDVSAMTREELESTIGSLRIAVIARACRELDLRTALQRIAITDDADCAIANDAKAMTLIAREALR